MTDDSNFSIALLAILGALVVAGSTAHAEQPFTQQEYVWFTAGQPSGTQTVKVYPDGRTSVHFTFNDRGRGPDTTTEMKLDAQGQLIQYMASGVNYFKGTVEEHFEIARGRATWRSTLEHGEAPSSADQLYFPVEQPPEYQAVLARALLRRSDRQLKLLPAGSVHIEEVESVSLAVEGNAHKAILYALSGLDLIPSYVWLDEHRTLIGYDAGWFAILRKDWSTQLPKIKAVQEAALARHIRAQTERFREKLDRPLAIVNARVLDVGAGRLSAPQTVLIRDGLIREIGPAAAVPANAYTLDAAGKTLMPALWDMHSHISPDAYLNYLASGVLSVRDMGNDPSYLAQLRKDITAGTVAAPDVYPMGFIDKKGPYAAPTGRLVQTLDEARLAVRAYAAEQYVGIKLYSSIEPSWVPELTREARKQGLTSVAGHIPAFMSPEQAIRDGYTEVTHLNMILLQLIGDVSIDTRTPQRFIIPGERGGQIDLDSKATQAFFGFMAERGIAHDPTLAVLMNQYDGRPGQINPSAVAFADHLPPSLRRGQIAAVSYNHGKEAAFRRTGEVALKLVKRLHDRGIRILPGSDSLLPGFVLVSELQWYARAGIANPEVLRLATLGAARHLHRDHELGSIAVGKKAYVMLVDGDPTRDLSVLRKVDRVVKGNAMFRARDILQAQGIRPF